jgi:hypothetical protein
MDTCAPAAYLFDDPLLLQVIEIARSGLFDGMSYLLVLGVRNFSMGREALLAGVTHRSLPGIPRTG